MAPYFYFFYFRFSNFKLLIAFAFILALVMLIRLNKKRKVYQVANLADMVILFILSSIIGGKLFYLVFVYPGSVMHGLKSLESGYVFYGGLILFFAALYYYARIKKINYSSLLDFICPVLGIGIAIGALACLMQGSCYGIRYSGIFSTVFPYVPGHASDTPKGVRLAPTQVLMVLNGLIVFAGYHGRNYFKNRSEKLRHLCRPGANFLAATLIYTFFTFLIDFLRDDYRGIKILSLSVIQWLSILIFFFAAYKMYKIYIGTREA
ncbi:MAG: prolipoprotein diacylglyceryl transferase [Oligoflexia bacterium]|nr:prolipoprotein diacylglyceryl transferase [Oligoflexia bacterium]